MSRILIVHHDKTICEKVKAGLPEPAHQVTAVHDGAAALEAFKEKKPEFVMINESLPDMTSFRLFGLLRKTDPQAKIIVLSLSGTPAEPRGEARFGIRTFSPEQIPIVVSELQTRVNGALVRPERPPANVLAVDDNPLIRDMLEDILTEEGYGVELAENGALGLEAVRKNRPDLVLLDIDMPELNGLETLKGIREFDTRVGVVMITGNDTAEMMEQCQQYGAFDYLTKPFDLNYLRFCVYSKILLATL